MRRFGMEHNMRPNSTAPLTLLMIALTCASAAAQDFPSRPVRFVVPYAAGGSGDMLARLLGSKLASMWGQQVVIDNRPGGGGLTGTELAARSEPDGYTLYLATDGPLTIAASLYKRVPYDWKRDFAPVSMVAMGYQVLIVGPSLPARNVQEFIALARQRPGELNYASIGIGSAPHLGAELFKSVAHVDIIHVPYRGSSAQAITALLAGDVSMFLVGTSTAAPYIASGALRALGVTARTRIDGLPDIPTFAEAGLPGMDVSIWFAVLVPAGTPPSIIGKLNADIEQVVADAAFQRTLAMRGFEARWSRPEQLAEFLLKDYIKFRDLIARLGLQVE
jgi:tripartite-type tricarboxylate transporter receptor subunit TctC